MLGTSTLESDTGKTVPLDGLKTREINRKAVRNLDSAHEECAHTCLLTKQGRGRRLKLSKTLAGFESELSTHSGPFCSVA